MMLISSAPVAMATEGAVDDRFTLSSSYENYLISSEASNPSIFKFQLEGEIGSRFKYGSLQLSGGMHFLTADQFDYYPQVREAYLGFHSEARSLKVSLGRKKFLWSYLDSSWELNLVQPGFRWEPSQPIEQGLAGIFLEFKPTGKKIEFLFYVSPMFLPTQGPGFKVIGGKVTSSNPWFVAPIEVINFSGKPVDLIYKINIPDISKVVSQFSYGAKISSRESAEGVFFNSFFLGKPRNDLVLPFVGQLNLTTLTGDVEVFPSVALHKLIGADIGYNWTKGFKLVASVVHEFDVSLRENIANSTYPVYEDLLVSSLSLFVKASNRHNLMFSVLYSKDESVGMAGTFAAEAASIFSYRNHFAQAVKFNWKSLWLSREQLSLDLDMILDTDESSMLVSLMTKYAFNKSFDMYVLAEALGTSQNNLVDRNLITRYQNKDRIMLGANYAF